MPSVVAPADQVVLADVERLLVQGVAVLAVQGLAVRGRALGFLLDLGHHRGVGGGGGSASTRRRVRRVLEPRALIIDHLKIFSPTLKPVNFVLFQR